MNDNENKHDLWGLAKTVLEKNLYLQCKYQKRKKESNHDLSFHLKKLGEKSKLNLMKG